MAPKSVLITGCSEGGIGDALAKEFHRKGLRVFATARNLAKVQHLKNLGLEILPLDVVDADSIAQAVESVRALTGGTLDILVNNSGYGYISPLLDTDISEAKKLFEVNVFAVIEVTKAFSPLLIASKGTIVNIGSVAGKMPLPWQGYYNASKAAIHLLTSQLRFELSPFDVKAICIVTGVVKTKFFANASSITLSSTSIYAPAVEEINIVQSGEVTGDDGQSADDYARAVVKNVLKRSPTFIPWVGGSAFLMWFLDTFLWATFFDLLAVLPTRFKMPQVKAKIQAAQKAK